MITIQAATYYVGEKKTVHIQKKFPSGSYYNNPWVMLPVNIPPKHNHLKNTSFRPSSTGLKMAVDAWNRVLC